MKRLAVIQLLCVAGLLLLMSASAPGFPSVLKIADTTVDPQARTLDGGTYGYAINGLSFQQEALITYNGWQYVTYYNGSGHVCVARRQLSSNGFEIGSGGAVLQSMFSLSWVSSEWAIVELTDYTLSTTWDAHNVVTMGICPNDGTIHLSFDHHGDTLNYRVSDPGVVTNPESIEWDASLFNSLQNYLVSGQTIYNVTYPRFWQTPSGDIQMGYRVGGSGDGQWYMADYDGTTGLWDSPRQVTSNSGSYSDSIGSSSSRNAYINPLGYAPDGVLHATWTWRESAGGANHDIMYAYSDDGGITWYNNAGQVIADTSVGGVITQASPQVTVVTLDRAYGTMNQQSQAIDSQGRVHTVMFHCDLMVSNTWGTVGDRRYYHYWRDSQGNWIQNALSFDSGDVSSYVGSRPKLLIRENGDAFVIYQSWQSVNLNSTALYISEGDLVIQAATAANQWDDWQIVHVESGAFLSEAIVDVSRFQQGILSVVMQESPSWTGQSTAIRVLDFQLNDYMMISNNREIK